MNNLIYSRTGNALQIYDNFMGNEESAIPVKAERILISYNTTDVKHTLCDKLQPHAVHPNMSIKRFLFS